MALEEAAGVGYSRWLIFARNGGSEGGCSTKADHLLITPHGDNQITMTLPLPGSIQRFSTSGSYYSASFTDKPDVSITASGSNAAVAIQLPAPAQYGVVAGELNLQTTTNTSSALRLAIGVPPVFQATIPAAPQDPEDYLATLPLLLPPTQQSRALAVPVAPLTRQPLSAAQACTLLREHALSQQAAGHDNVQVHLVQQICKAAGQPF